MGDSSPKLSQDARDALSAIPDSAKPTEKSDVPAVIDRNFGGSCHCDFIRYEAVIPLPVRPALPYAGRCNCTICLKTGFTSFALEGESDFTLRSPSSWEELGCYRGKNKEVARYFCPRCGVNVVGRGRYSMPEAPDEATSSRGERSEAAGDEERGGMVQLEGGGGEWMKLTEDDETGDDEVVNGVKASMVDFFALNLVTLDQPQEGLDLSVFRIQYWDGRRDLWMNGCKQVPWPGGIV